MDLSELKRLAGERAVDYVQEGMVLGLGSGSTVYYAIQKLSERVQAGLKVRCIPTSSRTEELARELGLPLTDFSEVAEGELDLVIDGADEVDRECNLIKGGGGALLREKLVASAGRKVIIVVDETKLVDHLGVFPLPVEVVPFGWELTLRRLERLGCRPTRREGDGRPFLTDNGNYILDCAFGRIDDPARLEREIDLIPGVVESGLFLGLADLVLIGKKGRKVEELPCSKEREKGSKG